MRTSTVGFYRTEKFVNPDLVVPPSSCKLLGVAQISTLIATHIAMDDPTQGLRELHETFQQLTGQTDLKYAPCERDWYEWDKAGFTTDDLRVTIAYIKDLNRKSNYPYSLGFGKVIGDLSRFNEMCALARCRERERKVRHRLMPEAKREILGATFRDNAPESKVPARSLRDALTDTIKTLPN